MRQIFGELYQRLSQVFPKSTGSNGESFFLKQFWLEYVTNEDPRIHIGNRAVAKTSQKSSR